MSHRFSHFGGVDFSGAREPLANLWTALGVEEDGKLEIRSLRPHAFRADLGTFVGGGWRSAVEADDRSAALWGVSFPCGLPASAARHLVGADANWSAVLAWVADRPADEIREALPDELRGGRLTDTGNSPLDTRSYKQTVEGLRWLHELREEHEEITVAPQLQRNGSGCTLVEVSPPASTIDLGLPRRRAPGRPGEYRARAAALRTFINFADPELECLAVTLEDAWDATLSCLTAWLVRGDLEQPHRLGKQDAALEVEGWIYRVPAALG